MNRSSNLVSGFEDGSVHARTYTGTLVSSWAPDIDQSPYLSTSLLLCQIYTERFHLRAIAEPVSSRCLEDGLLLAHSKVRQFSTAGDRGRRA
jgi:hypothetical protein